jgi:PAS domain S-box-containing protein
MSARREYEVMTATGESDQRVGEPVNILLVDDKRENLLALEAVLKPLGQNLMRANSGEEALKLLLRQEFAVILLDVQMPGLDGFETAAYIKQVEKTRHIPIIFLTAISKDASHVFQGYSVGAVDYLFKPYDPNVLRSKVSVFVDLYQKTAALAESEERFRKSFDNAPIGVALLDARGRWLEVNRALCQMLGYSEAQFLAMTLEDVLHPADPGIDLDEVAKALGGDMHAFHLEKLFVNQRGDKMHALISIALVGSSRWSTPYFILQVDDITERKRLEAFRDQFIGHAAHELRTPVSVLKGTADLLGDADSMTPEDVQRCLEVMTRQSQRLAWLVETLLDLSRLQEGHFIVKSEPVTLAELVEQVIQSAPPPDGKFVDVKIEDGAVALVDRRSLDQIVTNLLTNAYKYGGPHVSIEGERADGQINLVVADDGVGVPDDFAPRLFEPFIRGKQAATVQGSGLGLALVRSLAEANGGRIVYGPNDPVGARFVLSLETPDGG